MQLSSRILTALAVLILAVAVVAVRAGSPGTVEAATGTINVINVGTCYTTDTDVFDAADCEDGDEIDGYVVAERETAKKVDTVFATYAIDPKTSGEEPRAILINSDVIKINIEDEGRDKRTGKIYPVGQQTLSDDDSDIIEMALDSLAAELLEADDEIEDNPRSIDVSSPDANFVRGAGETASPIGSITNSGDAQFRLTGDDSTEYPMAPDGKVLWFGTVAVDNGATTFEDLSGDYITRDEDFDPGTRDSVAPWMRVSAAIPANVNLVIQYIYYQTSEQEELIGGTKKSEYVPVADANGTNRDVSPVFVDDEDDDDTEKQDALVLRASGDGNTPNQNLHLKEVGRFSGKYEGYLRLTDADGDGRCDEDNDDATAPTRCNWGFTDG